MMEPTASVVIAAHDEQASIGGTLRALTGEAAPEEFEVVVVCNGCTDRTAAVARQHAGVMVLELAEASKSAALRLGDRHTTVFPRLYLDADVRLTTAAARDLVGALAGDAPAVAGLRADIDVTRATRGVRWFYDFRERLPIFGGGVIGAGVYALNAAGRSRFGAWPDVLGDDLLVFRLFGPEERLLSTRHRTVATAPRDLGEVVRRGVRVRLGNLQLDRLHAGAELEPRPPAGFGAALRDAVRRPGGWPGAVTFVAVTALIRLRVRLGSGGGDWVRTMGEGEAHEPGARTHQAA
jgi:glycosyltransferase involved in cell wall biosynthesis